MLKAGADERATGENAVVAGSSAVNIIVGPLGIVVADALLGEVSTKMAEAVAKSPAIKILIPLNRCDIIVAGSQDRSTGELLADTIRQINDIIKLS